MTEKKVSNGTHYLAQGSFAEEPEAAASFWGSKPVRLGLGAIAKRVAMLGVLVR